VAAATGMQELTNVSWTVTSDDGSATHQLVLQAQAGQADGSATFTGVWDPANADGGLAVTGTLAYDAAGNIHLTFSAADGSSFDGTVTGAAGAYHLDGTLTPSDGSAPVHLAGDQVQALPAAAMQDLTGVSFTMTSLDNGTTHQLLIQTQADQPDGTATFTGQWDAANPNGAKPVTGTLAYDANGNITITFSWDGANTGDHTFAGTISNLAGPYHIDGNVTVADGSGPGHVVGDQDQAQPVVVTPVADLTNVSFTVTSDDGTVTHQVVIQVQAAQADGSATFTGQMDPANAGGGLAVTGTLTYDAAGNIHLTFSAADGSTFDGTISGAAGAYHLDGTLTPGDGSSPVHLAGDQDQPQPVVANMMDLTGVSFAMTSLTKPGNTYSITIQTQTNQADGSATITGLWSNGSPATGTLQYDAAGNITITFNWDGVQKGDHTFVGTISNLAGPYQIEGTVYVDGVVGGPGQLTGDQM
jgi:hypothetical protein